MFRYHVWSSSVILALSGLKNLIPLNESEKIGRYTAQNLFFDTDRSLLRKYKYYETTKD